MPADPKRQKNHPVNKKTVRVGGTEPADLAAEEAGQGIPLVWSHALLGSMAQDLGGGVLAWRDLVDIARVIRFDARGHGQSQSTDTATDYRWQNQANSLWEVADSYTEGSVVLGGASMGCGVSLHAACQHPDRVKGLVLVIPPRAWDWREGRAGGYRAIANIVKMTRGLPFRLLGRIPFAADEHNFRKNSRGVMARDLAGADYRGVVGAMRGAALSDFPDSKELARLHMPVLILAWPGDDIHPLGVAEELQRVLPDSRLEVAGDEGSVFHWPQLVREFLQSLA